MELRHLKYFVAVADSLSFSRAAESLYISQSALSQSISELESEFGVTLLNRSRKSVELTPKGRLLLEEAKSLLLQSEKLMPLIRHSGAEPAAGRSLFVAIEDRAADPVFRRRITRSVFELTARTPGTRSLFKELEFRELPDAVLSGELDLGIVLCERQEKLKPGISGRLLAEEEMVLAFRSGNEYPDDLASVKTVLGNRGLILLERDTRGMAQVLRILDALDVQAQIRFCNGRSAMTLTMECGERAAILPRPVFTMLDNPELSCLRLPVAAARLRLLALRREEDKNPLLHELIDTLAGG